MAVNVTYSSTGQVASVQRGTTSEKVDYDGQGRIVSRVFADGKTWSYTYLEKVRLHTEGKHRYFPAVTQAHFRGGQCHVTEPRFLF